MGEFLESASGVLFSVMYTIYPSRHVRSIYALGKLKAYKSLKAILHRRPQCAEYNQGQAQARLKRDTGL